MSIIKLELNCNHCRTFLASPGSYYLFHIYYTLKITFTYPVVSGVRKYSTCICVYIYSGECIQSWEVDTMDGDPEWENNHRYDGLFRVGKCTMNAFQGGKLENRNICMAIGWEPKIIIVYGNLTGNIQDEHYSNKH